MNRLVLIMTIAGISTSAFAGTECTFYVNGNVAIKVTNFGPVNKAKGDAPQVWSVDTGVAKYKLQIIDMAGVGESFKSLEENILDENGLEVIYGNVYSDTEQQSLTNTFSGTAANGDLLKVSCYVGG